MLRSSSLSLHYRATAELDRIRGMLRGRARLEKKIGLKRLFFLMRSQTRYRIEQQSHWNRAIVRKNIDSAAREHGSGWPYLRNDLARQNVILLPAMQQTLAQYEPLAFRCLMELCSSRIPPPPPPMTAVIPEEVYEVAPFKDVSETASGSTKDSDAPVKASASHPSAQRELKEGVARMLRATEPIPGVNDLDDMNSWVNAWKQFDVEKELEEEKG